ncbi:hypothetical protein [Vagococcus fessus]|uniref:Uncharacterized protein n=1 Tax=Vagococcus fessus TaxID=120370 RepID=A0A430A564_9ENTE|nr:hypothetical protein [Vagococcus fessus]RSU01942.1 hypothetical protein CBF31_09245 [Vagococcus fessus]
MSSKEKLEMRLKLCALIDSHEETACEIEDCKTCHEINKYRELLKIKRSYNTSDESHNTV